MKFFKNASLLRAIHKLPKAKFEAVVSRAHNYSRAVDHHKTMASSPFQRSGLTSNRGAARAEQARSQLHDDFMVALKKTGVPFDPKRRDQAERAARSLARTTPKPAKAGKLPNLEPKRVKLKKEWMRPPVFS